MPPSTVEPSVTRHPTKTGVTDALVVVPNVDDGAEHPDAEEGDRDAVLVHPRTVVVVVAVVHGHVLASLAKHVQLVIFVRGDPVVGIFFDDDSASARCRRVLCWLHVQLLELAPAPVLYEDSTIRS